MIDKLNGGINITENKFVINCKLTKSDFISSILFDEATSKEVNSYTHYYLKPKNIENVKFQINLIFNPNGKILNVFLGIYETDNPWENWSGSHELKRKELHDKWLEENLGNPPYDYSWGTVSSTYDPRSGSSTITFTYKT